MSVLLNTDLISVNIEAPDRNQVLTVMADKLNESEWPRRDFWMLC